MASVGKVQVPPPFAFPAAIIPQLGVLQWLTSGNAHGGIRRLSRDWRLDGSGKSELR